MYQQKIQKIIYFVRHGQSEDNVAPVFQSPNSPLNKLGTKQAKIIANRISNLQFEIIISSPFTRAKQTAEIIAKTTKKELEYSELFVERIKPSYVHGKPYTNKKASQLWRDCENSLYKKNIKISNGENFTNIIQRADDALNFLKNRQEKSIVVVTHGYFLRTIIARVLLNNFLSPASFKNIQKSMSMENTGLTVLQYRDNFEEKMAWRLWIYNDHAHLAE